MGVGFFQKFHDESSAIHFVRERLWPDGPLCPHCGTSKRIKTLRGASTQAGALKCYRCRKIFTVQLGTLFAFSNIPLHKWLRAIYLCGHETATPARLSKILGVSFKTASFMIGRIHFAATNSEKAGSTAAGVESSSEGSPQQPPPIEPMPPDARPTSDTIAFELFVHAANAASRHDPAEDFERRFGQVARAEMKLGAWREARAALDASRIERFPGAKSVETR